MQIFIRVDAYFVSRLLCGVVSSSLCYRILRRPYQALVSSIDLGHLDPAAVFVLVAYFFDTYKVILCITTKCVKFDPNLGIVYDSHLQVLDTVRIAMVFVSFSFSRVTELLSANSGTLRYKVQ